MTRPLKVYSWVASRPDLYRVNGHSQVRLMVAARSKAAAARTVGEDDPRRLFNLGETGNDEDCAAALAQPGRVFWRPLNGRRAPAPDPKQAWSTDEDVSVNVPIGAAVTVTMTNAGSGRVHVHMVAGDDVVLDQTSPLADALRYLGANVSYAMTGALEWPVGLPGEGSR